MEVSADVTPSWVEPGSYLLSVGIYKPHKNWKFLFRRYSEMADQDIKIVCAGVGNDRGKLAQLAKRYRLGDRIRILENQSDEAMNALYRFAKGLVFPSLAEGFGLPVLEAMTHGTPVLISNRSPMKEIARNCAFVFNPDYPESFDSALKGLLNDRVQRADHIANALEKSRRYTWAKTASRVEEALLRAMAKE